MDNNKHNEAIVDVAFHLGAEHVEFEARRSDIVSTLKRTALDRLHIVEDAAIDYLLGFRGQTVDNEAQTLGQLMANNEEKHAEFQIKKRPKGGTCR